MCMYGHAHTVILLSEDSFDESFLCRVSADSYTWVIKLGGKRLTHGAITLL